MTRFYYHPACEAHEPNDGHPECPDRLWAIKDALTGPDFTHLDIVAPPQAGIDQLVRVHSPAYIEKVKAAMPERGLNMLNADTLVSAGSWDAALYAAGAGMAAVDAVLSGEIKNAFCAGRPPGHHAEPDAWGGFCLFNNICVAAAHAVATHKLSRVAIVDFDVHHGNGTQDIVWDRPEILFISSHQAGIYPFSGSKDERGATNNILNLPLLGGGSGEDMRKVYGAAVFPRLRDYKPELILISAGYDAHIADPIGGLRWQDEDFEWLIEQLLKVAHETCGGKMVALLEGGYDLAALGRCVANTVRLMDAA
jgi:acetoin utilization deacetylase AcuC-like enzyme